ncbi:lasso peptide biosynthesis B2 protein [Ectobacillus sp. JY-23]|uniref:lasso peptide biosynthesis B2 protein n=1 Tax=Ectobacillus sp. JY-23 TaxID=2933872 RepID=UPI001FF56B1A|nr:lasso peptide biosynthesis B2 protein [Ectobacillus sp. JY-23]UOY92716.1 lasso peptide biosynthesis B2 protein [Ectobacillus sp. JY-23]
MNFYKKLKTLCSLHPKTCLLLGEAFVYLAWARILKALPFAKVVPLLGEQMNETSTDASHTNLIILQDISDAVHAMSLHTYWESMCLVRAIAAMKMLERRGIESTLYLGTARDENGQMIAHAWLRSGPFYITGAEEMHRFSVVGKFARKLG